MGLLSSLVSAGASIIGGSLNRSAANDAADKNAALQREFAQNGIRWRVADAKAAGLHPLAALGAQSPSASPVYSSTDNGLAQAGQDIGRALSARKTAEERAYDEKIRELEMRKRMAEINLLESQAHQARVDAQSNQTRTAAYANDIANQSAASQRALVQQPGSPPPTPSPATSTTLGTYSTGETVKVPAEVVTSLAGQPAIQAGFPPTISFKTYPDGSLGIFPPEDLVDMLSESLPDKIRWEWQMMSAGLAANQGVKNGFFPPRTRDMIERGEYWRYSPLTGRLYRTKQRPQTAKEVLRDYPQVKVYPGRGTGTGR